MSEPLIEAGEAREEQVTPPGTHALRLVLAMTLDRQTAAACMGVPHEAAVSLWPSSLYRVLAETALASPAVWQRCERCVDGALGECGLRFENHPPAELAQLFLEGRDTCSGVELAALLWTLVKRRCPAAAVISRRLGAELETIAAGRLASERGARQTGSWPTSVAPAARQT